ncbi:MAG: DMT family transporter, partial [Boseongicola sp.]|nr:DMT family transporter [Boseongicola sp.]
MAQPNPFRAISLKIASVLLFVLMATLIKAASAEVPPGQTVFFRSLCAMPVILGWLMWQGKFPKGLRTVNPVGHLWRGLIGSTAMGLSFAGLAILPLSEVKAIQYAMPLFVVILAALMLGERVRAVRLTAVGMGMAGVLIILWPRLTSFTGGDVDPRLAYGALIVLTGSLCAAFAQIFVRKLVET